MTARAAIERAIPLLQRGDLAGAAKAAGNGLRRFPDDLGLLRMMGYILQSQERFAEAADCYLKVVARDPGDAEIWNNLGNARRAAGDGTGAIAALEQARRLRPDLPAIHYNLGVSLAEAGGMEEAARAFAEAVRLSPGNPGGLLEYGRALRHLNRHAEALAVLDRAALLAPDLPDISIERGRALSGVGRFAEADEAYRAALAIQPDLATAFLERGLLLERSNQLDRLPALLDEAAQQGVSPDLAYLHALAFERAGDLAAARIAAEAVPQDDDPVRRAVLIGRLADKANDASAAFDAYREMNQLVAAQSPEARAGAAAYRAHVVALTDMITHDFVDGWAGKGAPGGRPAPVFLVGFPRSGTTLLDTLLMGHPQVHVLEEEPLLQRVGEALGDFARLPGLDEAQIARLRALYFAELDAFDPAAQGKLVIDKLPLNILGAPLIHRLFPDAKLIFAERHPCDVVLSCFMQNFDLNDAMANFLDLGDAATLYDLVLGFWTRCRETLPLDVHVLRYEALVADKTGALRSLLEFLHLAWNDAVLDNQRTAQRRGLIATPSYAQVAQPIYTRARGRWERYRTQLAPVLPILEPWAERLGYQV